MRRVIGIALLLLFSFPLISTALALEAGSGANLPACCRKNGAHHCMMNLQQAELGKGIYLSAIPQRCPAYPAAVVQARHGDLSLRTASPIFAEIVSHPSARRQVEARARLALDRSRQKRGPPSTDLP